MARKMAAMRAAKARRRAERIASGTMPVRPSRRRPAPLLELGLRDTRSGEIAWVPFRSLRDAMRRLTVVRRWYRPAPARAGLLMK